MVFSRFVSHSSDSLRNGFSLAAVTLVAVVVAACGSSTGAPGGANQSVLGATSVPSAMSAPVSAPVSTPVSGTVSGPVSGPISGAVGSPGTTTDPCQLVTASEAGTLAGMTFSNGTEGTASNNARTCTYGAPTTGLFEVIVAQAPSAVEAQAAEAAAMAQLKSTVPGAILQSTQVTGVGDTAVFVSASATAANVSGIDVVKGNTFFALVNVAVGKPAATQSALVTEAQTIAGRLPA